MNRLLLACALALAIPTAGCAALPDWFPRNDRGALEQTKLDEKGLWAAKASVYGAYAAAEAAVDSGLLKGAQAGQVKTYLETADKALAVADDAYKAGSAKTYADKIAAVRDAVGSAFALIPQKGV